MELHSTSPNRRLRILTLSEMANPELVSVPLVGWSLLEAQRRIADVHLVTQIRNREAIARAGLQEGTDFTCIDTEALQRPVWKIGNALKLGWTARMALSAMAYPQFERKVWKRFGDDIRNGRYDVVHRTTPLSPTINSPLAARCAAAGVPFVLGPLNGGVPWPASFAQARRREKEWLARIRGAYKLAPGRARMLAATDAILAGSRFTASELPQAHQPRTFYLPENAIRPERFDMPAGRPPAPPLRACFVGRLVPYKGPDMLLDAAGELLKSGRMVLDIVGDGPMMEEIRNRVAAGGLSDAVTLHGWLDHADVPAVLGQAHVLSFPSIREFGGGVVLEAMALGVVPVIVDYGGPGELVVPGTGVTIPIGTREDVVSGMRAALERLVEHPESLAPMAAAARARVLDHYTWDAKAAQIQQVYDWVLARRAGDTPDKPVLIP